jgi:type II restriction enzyme
LALAKAAKAEPYIADARRLRAFLERCPNIRSAAINGDFRTELLAAAGFSDKAQSHLSDPELSGALERVVSQIAEAHPGKWRDELLYRFLLTKGDSLGGSMRNYGGAVASVQLSEAMISALDGRGISHSVRRSASNADKIQAIVWPNRSLLFDRSPAFIGKNLDAILLDTSSGLSEKSCFGRQACYLACGELKGGIDPAGADEHWKTANSALERIRQAFGRHPPRLFFVGAAIEAAMADEIFAQLNDERLTFAANLTVPAQVADLANWLSSL